MENKNLTLWASVEKTNPNHTKKANVRGNLAFMVERGVLGI